MTDYLPILTPEEQLSDEDKALTSEQRLSKAHNSATRTVIDAHRADFNRLKADAAAALGIRWVPRKSAEEKALEEALELVAAHPRIRQQLLSQLEGEVGDSNSGMANDTSSYSEAGDDDPDRTEDLSGEPTPSVLPPKVVLDEGTPAQAWVQQVLYAGRLTADGTMFLYVDGGGVQRTEDFTLLGNEPGPGTPTD